MNLSVELQDLTPEIFARLTTPEIKRAVLVAALRETPYVPTVAEKTGTDVVTLWRLAKDESIRLRKTPAARPVELVYASPLSSLAEKSTDLRYISQETRSAIIAALKENPDGKAVARQYQGKASYATICGIAKENQILLNGRVSSNIRLAIIADLKQDPNVPRIAKQYQGKASSALIYKIAKENQIPFNKRVTEKTRLAIATDLRQNPNVTMLAKQYQGKASSALIYKIAKENQIPFNKRVTEKTRLAIATDLRQNPNVTRIAKQYQGIASSATIYKIAKENQILLKRGRRNKLSDTQILKIYNECKNITVTAQVAEIYWGTVARILTRLNQRAPGSTAAKRLKRRKANFEDAKRL